MHHTAKIDTLVSTVGLEVSRKDGECVLAGQASPTIHSLALILPLTSYVLAYIDVILGMTAFRTNAMQAITTTITLVQPYNEVIIS